MKFVDYNFVSDEDATKIMESYGYITDSEQEETPAETSDETTEEVVEESAELPDCVITRDAGVFGLCEDVEEIDGSLYIRVSPIEEDQYGALEENESTVLEAIDYEEETYNLCDIFQDEESGEVFVQIVKAE